MTSSRDTAVDSLRTSGYALLPAAGLSSACNVSLDELNRVRDSWEALPPDEHLRDGGRYRFRRHRSYVQRISPQALDSVPHRPHWQPTTYNALHGGIERWFEPIEPRVDSSLAWRRLILALGDLFAGVRPVDTWYVEAHQFRIDTAQGIGRPTPEGAHRDGVDFVAVILIGRRDIRGGETRVFDAHGISGVRFTMEQPWSVLLMDDERVIHETTPIQPDGAAGARDTLVITYRAHGFQSREGD